MIIRRAEKNDAEKFLKMLKQLDNETDNMMFEPGERKTTVVEMESQIIDIANSKSLILLVEEDDGEIIGFLSAERGFAKRIKHSAYIVVGLLNEYRGKKIGKKLFEKMEQWAFENNIIRLELTVMTINEGAIGLYTKMGFRIEGRKEKSIMLNDKYIDEYYMSKILINSPYR